jgi:hypothetical protein
MLHNAMITATRLMDNENINGQEDFYVDVEPQSVTDMDVNLHQYVNFVKMDMQYIGRQCQPMTAINWYLINLIFLTIFCICSLLIHKCIYQTAPQGTTQHFSPHKSLPPSFFLEPVNATVRNLGSIQFS